MPLSISGTTALPMIKVRFKARYNRRILREQPKTSIPNRSIAIHKNLMGPGALIDFAAYCFHQLDVMQALILGSTSPFRKALLAKLGIPFITEPPITNEARRPGEKPDRLVRRLAEDKARDVARRFPEALIIGSDQVACVGDNILGKPGNRVNAISQLTAVSGKAVTFYTGLCLYNAASDQIQVAVEPFVVHFRSLSRSQIERYVDQERPFNCAGSFKSEGFGITLFSALEGRDPNALVGLPLIRLVAMLDSQGISLP